MDEREWVLRFALQPSNLHPYFTYDSWCAPCRMLAPILKSYLANPSTPSQLILLKVNTDNHQSLAAKYHISSLPTVGLWMNGKQVDMFVGLRNEDGVRKFVEAHVGK